MIYRRTSATLAETQSGQEHNSIPHAIYSHNIHTRHLFTPKPLNINTLATISPFITPLPTSKETVYYLYMSNGHCPIIGHLLHIVLECNIPLHLKATFNPQATTLSLKLTFYPLNLKLYR